MHYYHKHSHFNYSCNHTTNSTWYNHYKATLWILNPRMSYKVETRIAQHHSSLSIQHVKKKKGNLYHKCYNIQTKGPNDSWWKTMLSHPANLGFFDYQNKTHPQEQYHTNINQTYLPQIIQIQILQNKILYWMIASILIYQS